MQNLTPARREKGRMKMKLICNNSTGWEVVFLGKNEDYPGTRSITTKRGYYLISPRWFGCKYLGAIKPVQRWLIDEMDRLEN